MTSKRIFDVVAAGLGLLVTSPLVLLALALVPLASPGPAIYRAKRVGRGGSQFTMYKLRTMRTGQTGGLITAHHDPRVFPLGRLLRKTKLDELPQLVNVLKGDMSIVGPRPEDPAVVANSYTPAQMETLDVRPGLTSPGSIYYYAHAEDTLQGDADGQYAERLLPVKLALDLVYVREQSLAYDLQLIARTVGVIVGRTLGRTQFPEPEELSRAKSVYGFI